MPAELSAGYASIHHSHTVHGSPPNRRPRPRRSIVMNFMAPDVRCAGGRAPLLEGVPLIPEGGIVEGDHFPIVLDLEKKVDAV